MINFTAWILDRAVYRQAFNNLLVSVLSFEKQKEIPEPIQLERVSITPKKRQLIRFSMFRKRRASGSKKPLKGYEIFQAAIDANIKQIRGSWGSIGTFENRACAIGAINFISEYGARPGVFARLRARMDCLSHFCSNSDASHTIKQIQAALSADGLYSIATLNDQFGWTFEQFRDYCKAHDI